MPANMQTYRWTGLDKKGNRISKTTEAPDIKTAQTEIKKMGIELIDIKEVRALSLSFQRKQKIKSKDIILFTRFLSTMLSAGVPILQSIDIIANDQENKTMQSMLHQIRTDVASGKTLTEAFRQFPKHFGVLYCSLISSGEKSGTLDKILNRLSVYLEKTETIKRKIKKALIYPTAIVIVSIVVSFILLFYVVPQFQSIFSSFGAELPYFTLLVVHLSNFVRKFWWLIFAGVIAGIFGFRYSVKNNPSFAERIDRYKLKIPVIGQLLQKGMLARSTRTLAISLDSGMPIVEAIKSMADIMDNRIYSKAILQIGKDVANGHQLNIAMRKTGLFPNMAMQMIAIGEASGMLGDMLNKIADYYEEDVNHMVDNLSNLLEPLIMILLGVIIGSFVIAMYLPIFKIGSIVK